MNPPELHQTPGYHHATVATAARLIFLAGQCPLAANGSVIGAKQPTGLTPAGALAEGLAAQVDQVVENTLTALAAAGAGPADVVRTVVYVVSEDRAVLAAVWHRFAESALGAAFGSASTLLGVAQLGYPNQRIELEVTAAL